MRICGATKDDIQSEFWNTSKKHYLELYKKSSHLHIKNHDLIWITKIWIQLWIWFTEALISKGKVFLYFDAFNFQTIKSWTMKYTQSFSLVLKTFYTYRKKWKILKFGKRWTARLSNEFITPFPIKLWMIYDRIC